MTSTPSPSRRDNPKFIGAEHRQYTAAAFHSGAETYADIRPGYPAEVIELLEPHPRGPILDVGAGTGKLTEQLPGEVWALDPSADMLGQLRASISVPVWQATAEATALPNNSVAAVASAQTWHWVDPEAASKEMARVIKAGGPLVLAWNTLDVRVPWVHRLTRIMHAGDVQKPGFYPDVAAPWRLSRELRLEWEQILQAKDLFRLMATRAYWLRNGSKVREKMTSNLSWYLYEHLGFEPEQPIALPYRCDAFRYER
ncbi:class I SAM-dependent methyltransferase [Corynebacterium hindlerae]|uniref:class I SAM-dependent methyltransferase n=1 Tax=Corynebacterium hindlerae TaxID=699041 RepID=UPI0031B67B7C